ncbi:MAG: prevent-host-death family protein [Acidobacteriota bacterium]|nr:prevent-host-death family protein [Acidobacteriota bacterium]
MSRLNDSYTVQDFTIDPDRVIGDLAEKNHVTLTRDGEGVAVVQTIHSYEADQEEKRFMRAVVQGLADIENGRDVSLEDARRRLGIN